MLIRLVNWVYPMCPRGGHRQRGDLVTNFLGNRYCHHPDCVKANFAEVRKATETTVEQELHLLKTAVASCWDLYVDGSGHTLQVSELINNRVRELRDARRD